jgi:GT2 family glycosyltransferase
MTSPVTLLDVDVAQPIPAVSAARSTRAWMLVRAFTEPLGESTVEYGPAGLTPSRLAAHIEAAFGDAIRSRVAAAGGDPGQGVPVGGVTVPRPPAYLASRAEILATAPPITVVVCTREHPDALRACLDSLVVQDYPNFRILVVDNAPTTDDTARVVAEFSTVDYLREPKPGLSRARNAAVAVTPGEILAFTDDDVVVDEYWLAEVARGLAEHPEADVLSGLILPAELETQAQVWFEEFGGHSKGRGFTPAVFSPATAHVQHPLYPLPPYGTGANMVFRPGVIESFGGFDPALGAGTPAMGSEDTHAFMKVLSGGGTVAYVPTALVRHYHRRDMDGLRTQLVGYGTGLTAAYASLVRSDPRVLGSLLRLVPAALRDLRGGSAQRESGLGPTFPRELLGANKHGMLRGPMAYLKGRRMLKGHV